MLTNIFETSVWPNTFRVYNNLYVRLFTGPELPMGIYFASLVEHPQGGVLLVGGVSHSHILDSFYLLSNTGNFYKLTNNSLIS